MCEIAFIQKKMNGFYDMLQVTGFEGKHSE